MEILGRVNILVGKCPVGEVSVGKVSGRGIVCSWKCPHTPQQRYDRYTESHGLSGDSEHIIFNSQS